MPTPLGYYPIETGEAGVANKGYPFGDVRRYGAVSNGTTDDLAAFQKAIDAADARSGATVVRVPPGTTSYVSDRIQLRADNCTFDATGATIIGPTVSAFFGDMIAIGDQRTPTRIIDDAHILGGTWKPRATTDNAIGIVSASRFSVRSIVVILPAGSTQAAVVCEPTYATDGIIDGVTSSGGREAVYVANSAATAAVERIVITNIIGKNSQYGLRVRGDAADWLLKGVTVSNITVDTVSIDAFHVFRCQDATLSNLVARNVSGHGLYLIQPDNVVVTGIALRSAATPTASSYGIFTQPGVTPGKYTVVGAHIVGAWAGGVKPETHDGTFDDIHVSGAAVGIHNGSLARTTWGAVTYANVTTPVNNVNTVTDQWNHFPQKSGVNPRGVIGADRGNAFVQTILAPELDAPIQRWATALTLNQEVLFSTTNAIKGQTFRIVRTGLGAFTLTVGTFKVIPANTAAFVEVMFDGAAWVLTGYGLL